MVKYRYWHARYCWVYGRKSNWIGRSRIRSCIVLWYSMVNPCRIQYTSIIKRHSSRAIASCINDTGTKLSDLKCLCHFLQSKPSFLLGSSIPISNHRPTAAAKARPRTWTRPRKQPNRKTPKIRGISCEKSRFKALYYVRTNFFLFRYTWP